MSIVSLASVLQKIATGPHLSKDLTQQEAFEAAQAILAGHVHEVQSALFFIALRMKRETADEMIGVLRAIVESAPSESVRVPQLLTFADPYAGYERGLPASGFVPAVLSALGVPSVTHSPDRMSPKYGLTVRSVLQACGVSIHHTIRLGFSRSSGYHTKVSLAKFTA